jgi:hypothetical protein
MNYNSRNMLEKVCAAYPKILKLYLPEVTEETQEILL